ncbi:hypothetical protein BRD17_09490 [Halobacteriales archaeon SW_7_68_16]|nr:MAG: hypothetical protein BRD17_09490 [Halobacteriales archaeon SW_7_68_16]
MALAEQLLVVGGGSYLLAKAIAVYGTLLIRRNGIVSDEGKYGRRIRAAAKVPSWLAFGILVVAAVLAPDSIAVSAAIAAFAGNLIL